MRNEPSANPPLPRMSSSVFKWPRYPRPTKPLGRQSTRSVTGLEARDNEHPGPAMCPSLRRGSPSVQVAATRHRNGPIRDDAARLDRPRLRLAFGASTAAPHRARRLAPPDVCSKPTTEPAARKADLNSKQMLQGPRTPSKTQNSACGDRKHPPKPRAPLHRQKPFSNPGGARTRRRKAQQSQRRHRRTLLRRAADGSRRHSQPRRHGRTIGGRVVRSRRSGRRPGRRA